MTASSGSLREGVEGTAGLTLTFPAFTWLPVTALTFSGLPWAYIPTPSWGGGGEGSPSPLPSFVQTEREAGLKAEPPPPPTQDEGY